MKYRNCLHLLLVMSLGISLFSCREDEKEVIDEKVDEQIELAKSNQLSLSISYPKVGVLPKQYKTPIYYDYKECPIKLTIRDSKTQEIIKKVEIGDKTEISLELEDGLYDFHIGNPILTDDRKAVEISSKTRDLSFNLSNCFISKTWVMSELHYTWSGGGLSACYVELFNNSDEVLYADGISFSRGYALGTEHYDIFQEFGGTNIVPYYIWTAPGNGTDYPIQPGEKCLISVSGLDFNEHGYAFNLSSSKFEMFAFDRGDGFGTPTYINTATHPFLENYDVPNMLPILLPSNTFPMHMAPYETFFIFQPPKGQDIKDYLKEKGVKRKEKNGEYVFSYRIPVEDIIDLVQNGGLTKTTPSYLDEAYTYVNTDYNGYEYRVSKRKVLKRKNGRDYLQDSNNSYVDFEHNVMSSYCDLY